MLLISLVVSAFGLSLIGMMARSQDTRPRTIIAGGFFLGCAFSFPAMCLLFGVLPSMMLGVVASLVWRAKKLPDRRLTHFFVLACVGGHTLIYLIYVRPGMQRYAAIREAVAKHSLEGRLPKYQPAIRAKRAHDGLDDLEETIALWDRFSGEKFQLKQIHGNQVWLFVNHEGFGMTRMFSPSDRIEAYLPTRSPIPQLTRLVTSQARPLVEHPIEAHRTSLEIIDRRFANSPFQ